MFRCCGWRYIMRENYLKFTLASIFLSVGSYSCGYCVLQCSIQNNSISSQVGWCSVHGFYLWWQNKMADVFSHTFLWKKIFELNSHSNVFLGGLVHSCNKPLPEPMLTKACLQYVITGLQWMTFFLLAREANKIFHSQWGKLSSVWLFHRYIMSVYRNVCR